MPLRATNVVHWDGIKISYVGRAEIMTLAAQQIDASSLGNPLRIETFDQRGGGHPFFKAIGHPFVRDKIAALKEQLQAKNRIGILDPFGCMNSFLAIHPFSDLPFVDAYVQDYKDIGKSVAGITAKPITALKDAEIDCLFIIAFDSQRLQHQLPALVPKQIEVISLDHIRLPDELLSNQRQYLSPLNFATNFAFFRADKKLYTRITTANYWSSYNGRKPIELQLLLLDEQGKKIIQWEQSYETPGETIVLDSREIQQRFNLGDFTGQLFIHVIHAAGHDIVKYALDVYSTDSPYDLSCTHDANAWPADYYAGLPAPEQGESVTLWIQNSHPCPIPPRGVGLSVMGRDEVRWYEEEIPPFGTVALDTASLWPEIHWPQQFEIHAGKYFVRPRYEIIKKTPEKILRRIAHANVERTDLKDDPEIQKLSPFFDKSYILPAPILPRDRWLTSVLPTPMSVAQANLPIAIVAYDAHGHQVLSHRLGKIDRGSCTDIDVDKLVGDIGPGWGHLQMIYDFSEGGYADGWLHGLFRYEDKHSGHLAESSFGAHIYNTLLTYKSEPQSYVGPPPGLSTRLFLRIDPELETFCHLIYPASQHWYEKSSTTIMLHDGSGKEIASRDIAIARNGSLYFVVSDMFPKNTLDVSGKNGYITIRDGTCRLFGYHGLTHGKESFCLDHMFGF